MSALPPRRLLTLAATLTLAAVALSSSISAQRAAAAGETIYVVSSYELLRFDSSHPYEMTIVGTLKGLQGDEKIVAIDFRPSTGQLYGIGDTGRLYRIDKSNAVATPVGTPFALADPSTVSMDFDPVVDRIRVVSAADDNFRLNPDTGAVVGTDTKLAYDAGDVKAAANPNVKAIAYTNNFAGATATTLYGIDNALRNLVRQGGVDGVPSPNSGTLFTIGPLGAYSGTDVGLDVASTGTAFAYFDISVPPSFGAHLFTIDLATGAATRLRGIGSLFNPIDIAVHFGPAPPITTPPVAAGDTIFVVSSRELLRIDNSSDTFGAPPSFHIAIVGTLAGLQAAEELVAIDFRPATGQLYGIGDTGRLYTIDTSNAVATPVGPPFALADPVSASMDFDPVDDRIRVISAADESFRLNPDTGAVAGTGTDLAYVAGDTNGGANPNVLAIAYTNNFAGAAATTLYGIDNDLANLVRLGGLDGVPSPNTGTLFTIGAIGISSSATDDFGSTTDAGLDIASSGTAFAYLNVSVPPSFGSHLFSIDLATGAATRLGGIGSLYFPIDIAAQVGSAPPIAPPGALPDSGGRHAGDAGLLVIPIFAGLALASAGLVVSYRLTRSH